MSSTKPEQFSNLNWLQDNPFTALSEISWLLNKQESSGRDALIRVLEHEQVFTGYQPILTSLIQKAGLYPYLTDKDIHATDDLLGYEFHRVDNLDDIVLHSVQGKVYRYLVDGANVILSAPTSFGKSLLIDAMIASGKFKCIVVIVPTIALIDETRRRLSRRFSPEFKIVTHPSQKPSEKNIYVLTQERFVEFEETLQPEFFVLDEFYKLSPTREDERTFVLNQTFYRLIKTGAQFFLIGPNIRGLAIDEKELDFRFIRTDFSTVATEVRFSTGGNEMENALALCEKINEPTLIYCKSSTSAYKLAKYLLDTGVFAANKELKEISQWLRNNYHPEWFLADLLEHGFAVHHGSLPRSVAYHLLRKFNEGAIRFLLCTSTIIEGVNTAAKNIIIYDNKIATTKFDQFTFNNIKGRAGRMFKHFVGHVYVLHKEPDPELPFVDVPSITQPDNTPETLLIQLDKTDLSEHSLEKLRYLYGQDILPMEVMRSNSGMPPAHQLGLATEIAQNLRRYHPLLSWSGFPKSEQLRAVCTLIYDHLMEGKPRDGILSAKQLYFKISQFASVKKMTKLVQLELQNNNRISTATEAVESVLSFLRRWGEYNFPRYLSALDSIQRSVFVKAKFKPGNYEVFGTSIKQMFMPLSATVLEEYGLPFQVTLKIEKGQSLGNDVDQIIEALKTVNLAKVDLSAFEREMIHDTVSNI